MRTVAAAFDTAVMTLVAWNLTGGVIDAHPRSVGLWGSAAASLVVTLCVRGGAAVPAWIAIGFIFYASLLASRVPILPLLALAAALAPVAPRPRRSVALGLAVAAVSAFAFDWAAGAIGL